MQYKLNRNAASTAVRKCLRIFSGCSTAEAGGYSIEACNRQLAAG